MDQSVFPQSVHSGLVDRGGHTDLNEENISATSGEMWWPLGSACSLERW